MRETYLASKLTSGVFPRLLSDVQGGRTAQRVSVNVAAPLRFLAQLLLLCVYALTR